MISKEELEKLTVAQIKEKLKSRKLPTGGTKPDLVSRLYENILDEEKLLGTLEPAGPSDIDVDVDEVLGLLDNEPGLTSQEKKKNASVVKPVVKPVQITTSTTNVAKPTDNSKDDALDVEQQPAATKKEPKRPIEPPAGDASAKTVKTVANGKAEETTTTTTLTTTDASAADRKTSGLSSDEEQKMLNRAKRLGLPVGAIAIAATTTTPSTEDVLKKRAERFGPVNEESAKKQARMQRFGLTNNSPAATAVSAIAKDEALQKRAQRFGLPVGGVSNGSYNDTKKQARAQRFGSLASDSVAVKRPSGASAEELATLEKRAKRFGITSGN